MVTQQRYKGRYSKVLTAIAAAVLVTSLQVLVALFVGGVFATKTSAAENETTVLSGAADVRIVEASPDWQTRTSTSLIADGDDPGGSGKDISALLKWDASSIAPGTKIGTASITLTVTNGSAQTYEAYALKRAWTESGAT